MEFVPKTPLAAWLASIMSKQTKDLGDLKGKANVVAAEAALVAASPRAEVESFLDATRKRVLHELSEKGVELEGEAWYEVVNAVADRAQEKLNREGAGNEKEPENQNNEKGPESQNNEKGPENQNNEKEE